MSESPSSSSLASDQVGESPAVDLIGKIMVVIIIILFMVVVSALAVHFYAKVFRWRRTSQSQSRPRSVVALGTVTRLDPSVLKSLPVSVFQPHDYSKENGVECSVCLSELVEGEKLRVLPKCNHGFHVNCIDMWFQSHATCPLCRTLVVASQPQPGGDLESQSFPTNVLIWGNQTQITSSSSSSSTTAASLEESTSNNTTSTTSTRDRMLVIDIPGGHGEEEENSSSSSSSSSATATTSRFAEDDLKSPVLRRLRSLRRLLSNNMLNPWTTPTSSTQTTTKGEEGHS